MGAKSILQAAAQTHLVQQVPLHSILHISIVYSTEITLRLFGFENAYALARCSMNAWHAIGSPVKGRICGSRDTTREREADFVIIFSSPCRDEPGNLHV